MKPKNPIVEEHEEWVVFRITSKTHGVFRVSIDREDIPIVSQHTWKVMKNSGDNYFRVTTNLYPEGGGNPTSRPIHHFIFPHPAPGLMVDHINRDTMDNRKRNLRIANRTTQNCNISAHGKIPYRGICQAGKKFTCTIWFKNRRMYLGTYPTVREAVMARNDYILRNNLPFTLDKLPS